MKITKYKLVVAPVAKIEELINGLIKDGWQPFGPPCVLPPLPDLEQVDTVHQAMVMTGK